MPASCPQLRFRKTRSAVIWTSLLNEPLLTLYTLISFILHKDLQATSLQIAVLTMLRPVVSIVSLYWSASSVFGRRRGLIGNLVVTGVLARLPFFFFPFVAGPWPLILGIAFYMMLSRGGAPAWMEVIRRNLPDGRRGAIFSTGSALAYLEGAALAIGLGVLLDHSYQAWRWLFPLSALLGMAGVALQARLPVARGPVEESLPRPSFTTSLLMPWKQAVDLLRSRPDFRRFQWAFMFGGSGIMVVLPALPLFFVDVLGLTYTDLAIALTVCKGIGFALASPFWAKGLHRVSISRLTTFVFVCMGSFPLLLVFAQWHLLWLYAAYTVYGIAQAGSHLVWNLSGPMFAKEEDSAPYTSVNVLMVGVRGSLAPPIGSVLCAIAQPATVLLVGGSLFALGSYYLLRKRPLLADAP